MKSYLCTECGETFQSWIRRKNHIIRNHSTGRSYKCDKCDKAFYTNFILDRHKLTHTNIYTHVCGVCGKGFRRKQGLKRHIQSVHSNTVYNCELCDITFRFPGSYYTHIETHDIERNFECIKCHEKFGSQHVLKKHFKKHLKPYKCGKCVAGFDDENSLQEHICVTYECNLCSKTYFIRKSYTNHVSSHKGTRKRVRYLK